MKVVGNFLICPFPGQNKSFDVVVYEQLFKSIRVFLSQWSACKHNQQCWESLIGSDNIHVRVRAAITQTILIVLLTWWGFVLLWSGRKLIGLVWSIWGLYHEYLGCIGFVPVQRQFHVNTYNCTRVQYTLWGGGPIQNTCMSMHGVHALKAWRHECTGWQSGAVKKLVCSEAKTRLPCVSKACG